MKTAVVKAGLLALAMGVSAGASAQSFNYNYVEGGFGQLDDGDAVFVNGAMDINKNWGIVGGLEVGSLDIPYGDADVTLLEIGAQYHDQVKSNFSVQAGLKLLYADVEFEADICAGSGFPGYTCKASGSDDEIGLVGNVGGRLQVQPQLQLEGDIKLIANDALEDDGLGLQGAVRYYFDPKLSVAGGLAIDTELDGLYINLRYDL